MVAKLVRRLDALDYPRGKLDIKLVVERDDDATRTALESLDLPARYEIVVAPPGLPATKPRALNVALPAARGALVVVYDAEDEPDADQLRLAAARFAAEPAVDCLQAALTIDNAANSWISAMFAIEYATLFDLINPWSRRARPADPARRHLQPFPHRERCGASAPGTPGTSPRTPTSACGSLSPAPASARSRRRRLRKRRPNSPPGFASACAGRRAGCRR